MVFTVCNSMVCCRFELVKRLGEGSYGVVVAARDRETGKRCAIKKVRSVLCNSTYCRQSFIFGCFASVLRDCDPFMKRRILSSLMSDPGEGRD